MRLPLIVKTVAVGQYVVNVETTCVTVVVPNRPLVTVVPAVTPVRKGTVVLTRTLDRLDAAVLEATVLLDRVTAV